MITYELFGKVQPKLISKLDFAKKKNRTDEGKLFAIEVRETEQDSPLLTIETTGIWSLMAVTELLADSGYTDLYLNNQTPVNGLDCLFVRLP